MVVAVLSALDVDAMLEDGTLEDLTRADLERMDYDPPKERCALVTWRSERVDEFGEVFPGCWSCEMAGDAKRWRELHTWGVLMFGDPPWRRSQVLRVVGRLGSVEAAVKALPAPGVDFGYSFSVDEDTKSAGLAAVERRLPALGGKYGGETRTHQRRRWRRAASLGEAEPAEPARPRQGSLF